MGKGENERWIEREEKRQECLYKHECELVSTKNRE